MDIRSVRHMGRRFVANDDASGLPANFVERIRNIVSFLQEMESVNELKSIAVWRAQQLLAIARGCGV
jgi:toxin HigB-1